MADTFEQYEKNKAVASRRPSMSDLLGAAMDQTELLQGVARRVQAFVDQYQKWADLDPVYQEVKGVPDEGSGAALMFDDLKILLEKFPQKDF